jgi:hypothetical protein
MLPLCLRLGKCSGAGLRARSLTLCSLKIDSGGAARQWRNARPQNLRDFKSENQSRKLFGFCCCAFGRRKTSSKFHRGVLYGCKSELLGRRTRKNLPPASGFMTHTRAIRELCYPSGIIRKVIVQHNFNQQLCPWRAQIRHQISMPTASLTQIRSTISPSRLDCSLKTLIYHLEAIYRRARTAETHRLIAALRSFLPRNKRCAAAARRFVYSDHELSSKSSCQLNSGWCDVDVAKA